MRIYGASIQVSGFDGAENVRNDFSRFFSVRIHRIPVRCVRSHVCFVILHGKWKLRWLSYVGSLYQLKSPSSMALQLWCESHDPAIVLRFFSTQQASVTLGMRQRPQHSCGSFTSCVRNQFPALILRVRGFERRDGERSLSPAMTLYGLRWPSSCFGSSWPVFNSGLVCFWKLSVARFHLWLFTPA